MASVKKLLGTLCWDNFYIFYSMCVTYTQLSTRGSIRSSYRPSERYYAEKLAWGRFPMNKQKIDGHIVKMCERIVNMREIV